MEACPSLKLTFVRLNSAATHAKTAMRLKNSTVMQIMAITHMGLSIGARELNLQRLTRRRKGPCGC